MGYKTDQSYGIIPLKKEEKSWKILLVRHGKGHWAFPKGHADPGEEPHQAAIRELKEETGLDVVRFWDKEPIEERYMFRWKGELISKIVIYFLAEVEGGVVIQEEEISDYQWLPPQEAIHLATFPATKQVCSDVQLFLDKD